MSAIVVDRLFPRGSVSTTAYLHTALNQQVVALCTPDAPTDIDRLGSLVVQPQASLPPDNMPHPRALVLNDRVSRHPLPWLRHLFDWADRIFTLNLPEAIPGLAGDKFEWLPGAYEPGMHDKVFEEPHTMTKAPLVYVGTFNAWRKWRFLHEVPAIISGDGWEFSPLSAAAEAKYGWQYAYMLNRSEMAVNVLQSRWGPNRKTFEIPHQTLMLCEWAPGVDRVFAPEPGWQWAFTTPTGLAEAVRYYTDNPSEVEKHRREQAAQVSPYTYDRQAKRIVEFLRESA